MSSSRTVNDDFSPVSELSVLKKLCSVNPAKAQGPDSIPGWLLKENADLLTPTPTHHGYHEYLLLGRLGALILERSSLSIRPSYGVRGEEILDGGGGRGRRERKA